MIEGLPGYVSPTFIATTFLTVGFLFYAIKSSDADKGPANAALFLVAFAMVFQMSLAIGGFYMVTDTVPPRIILFAVLPAIATIVVYFAFFRASFVERLPLGTLTLLHTIRVPVEIVLYWLFEAGQIPQSMTFEGRNFDILSGLTAPVAYFLAFRRGRTNRALLTVWNLAALLLLANIVITAALSVPTPIQQLSFDQPNRAVLYFPFVWLPAIVVPIVLFSHLASLYKLFTAKEKRAAGNN
jgi:uncharacterized membrane protein